mmetsp:Transcript_35717/g.85964  ORF Transcript_35717/g.85964 Transcript_35717/m.85964 type:complete len:285 (-) Transcript_35717:85-939(-)
MALIAGFIMNQPPSALRYPPSIGTVHAVHQLAAGEAKNKAALVTSSRSPYRPIGQVLSRRVCSRFWAWAASASVFSFLAPPKTRPVGPPSVPETGPGAIPTTLIPYSAHSSPNTSVSRSIPALALMAWAWKATAWWARGCVRLMITVPGPVARSRSKAARDMLKVPLRSMSITVENALAVRSSANDIKLPAAPFTSTSSLPHLASTLAIAASHWAMSRTSQGTWSRSAAAPALLAAAAISSRAPMSLGSFRPQMATLAPIFAKPIPMWRPRPLPPPVMNTTRPS